MYRVYLWVSLWVVDDFLFPLVTTAYKHLPPPPPLYSPLCGKTLYSLLTSYPCLCVCCC